MKARAALLTVLAGAALAVPAAPAAAAACSQGGGVTLVVDFASLGGGTKTRCAAGDPASGVAALRAAGFSPTRAAQEPGYFVCRIDGKPANDPCQRTSPADAYWSYWHAKPGGTWAFSDRGAANYDPAPGTVEGWAFGAGKPPSSPPPRETAASSAASPASTPAASSAAAPAPSPRAVVPTSTAPQAVSAGSAAAAPPASPTALASLPAVPTPSPRPTPTSTPSATAAPHQVALKRGSASGVLLAAVLVALLAAAGGRLAWQRRRAGRVG
jgi:hypothetical protein